MINVDVGIAVVVDVCVGGIVIGLDGEKHDWQFRLVVSTSGIYGTP